MPIAELFLGLYNHRAMPTYVNYADFSEVERDELDAIALLFPLNFDETGDQIKQILEKRYIDGISGFEGVEVEGNKIIGVFYDIVSPSLTKKFNFTIDAKSGDVDYTQIDTGNLDTSFSEYSFATKGKSKQCKEGKSSACTRADGSTYCIKVGYKCKSVGLSAEEKALAQKVVEKRSSSDKKSKLTSKPKPELQREDNTKPLIKQSDPAQSKIASADLKVFEPTEFDNKTVKKIDDWLQFSGEESGRTKNADQLLVNQGIIFGIRRLAGKKAGDFVGIQDEQGNLQAGAVITKSRNHIYIDLLATAPWNVSGTDGRKVKGAGTSAMRAIVQKSIDSGFGGKIKLSAVDTAVSFYEKLGFKRIGNSFDMQLSPQKAKEFMEKTK